MSLFDKLTDAVAEIVLLPVNVTFRMACAVAGEHDWIKVPHPTKQMWKCSFCGKTVTR